MSDVPAFDSTEWRTLRNTMLHKWVGDKDAIKFVLLFADICEVWDDLIDQDKPVNHDDIHRAFWSCLIDIPDNMFFDRYKHNLLPLMITGINAWMDANQLEKGDDQDKVFSYVLRDWYMEFLSFVIYLTRGRGYMRQVSMDVRRFFTHHETLEQYKEKLA